MQPKGVRLAHDLPDGADALARRAEDVLGAIERAELHAVTAEGCTDGMIPAPGILARRKGSPYR